MLLCRPLNSLSSTCLLVQIPWLHYDSVNHPAFQYLILHYGCTALKRNISRTSFRAAQHSYSNLLQERVAEMFSPHARHRSFFEGFYDHNADNDEESQVNAPYLPTEVPDSQPETSNPNSRTSQLGFSGDQQDRLIQEFLNATSQSDFSSFCTTATELLPTPLQLTKAYGYRFVSHGSGSSAFSILWGHNLRQYF